MIIIDPLHADGKAKNEFSNLKPNSILLSLDKGLPCFLLRILCNVQIFGFKLETDCSNNTSIPQRYQISAPDHCNKSNISIKRSKQFFLFVCLFFCFPTHIRDQIPWTEISVQEYVRNLEIVLWINCCGRERKQ